MIYRPVVGDTEQPGGKRQPSIHIPRQRFDHLYKYLAGKILSRGAIVNAKKEIAEDGWRMQFIQLRDGIGVAGLRSLNEPLFLGEIRGHVEIGLS
jgi:hypothetical protein